MKKLYLYTFFIFALGNAQNDFSVSVNYLFKVSTSEYTTNYNTNSLLKANNQESLFEIDHLRSFYPNENTENFYGIKPNKNEFIYKNFETKNMFYIDYIEFKDFNIKDSLNIMDWTLNENTKKILGYQCQEATTNYGGRSYIAYYTPEIPISDGPWHFNGLPGLILEVHSIDKIFNLEANSIEIKNEKIEIKNPFENQKNISWQEFLNLYKKKYDEVLRNNMTEFGPGMELAKKSIVEYIKD